MTLITNVPGHDLPLCPRSMWSIEHLTKNRTLDAFSDVAGKDEDGEFTSEAVAEAYGAAGERLSDRMFLYHEQVSAPWGQRRVTVESWYFQCPACGCILPAQRTPST